MRILHVLSAEFYAGSVAYAVQLAEAHRAAGHAVWLLSDAPNPLPTGATQRTAPISDRRYAARWRNLRRIRALVQQEQIDVVHAHARAASWVCHAALRGLPVPLVSTVHGRQHLHASTSLFDVYGDRVIAICANLRAHLVAEVKMDAAKIVEIPNGVGFFNEGLAGFPSPRTASFNVGPHPPAPSPKKERGSQTPENYPPSTRYQAPGTEQRLSFIGRFNGGKGERAAGLLQHVFPALLAGFPGLRLALVGGELQHLPDAGKTALAALQAAFDERVEVVGFTDDVPGWLGRSTLVVGAGRVAIEALGAGCPVLALGEAGSEGIVTEATFATAAASNFGDIAARQQPHGVDFKQILIEIQQFLAQPVPVPAALAARVRAHYNLAAVAARVLLVYEAARMQRIHPQHIPVLMYHKVPDVAPATKHQIFVTKDNFARHLAFFRRRGLTPITFADYLAFARAQRPLADFPKRPVILTFDDGYEDNYVNLLPLMQHYGYRGVLYLLGDFAADHNHWDLAADPTEPRAALMSEAQKHAFVAAGWEIGAHTLSHPHLPALPLPEAIAEIKASKQALEARLHLVIETFAYPYGDLNAALKNAVQAAGFALGVATDTGGLRLEDDRMQVFRVNMFPNETWLSLYKKTSVWYRAYYLRKRGR